MTTRLEDESYQLEEDRKSRAEHQVKLFSSASTVIQRHYRGYRFCFFQYCSVDMPLLQILLL